MQSFDCTQIVLIDGFGDGLPGQHLGRLSRRMGSLRKLLSEARQWEEVRARSRVTAV
jgi:hypothetical protein